MVCGAVVCVCVCVPFTAVVCAVEAVPLRVKLRESICNLCNLSSRRIPDGVRLTLMDGRDLLAQTLQIIFDILQKDKCEKKQRGQAELNEIN